ncbi:MAG: formate/nitrite transporter family protein [Actinomycetota bacterium]|nr:formate/nitrite transporter family protein [Actinomycetota bacterium]
MSETKTAGEIYETVSEDGKIHLSRASLGLAFSGLSAGLNISFGALAMFSVAAITGEVSLAAIAVYPLGFLMVVLGRAQLFTETTVTPVAVVLSEWGPRRLANMLRLWAMVLVFNLVGALISAAAISYTGVLNTRAFAFLLEEVAQKMEHDFLGTTLYAVYGGWVVALMAWLVAASTDTIGKAFVIWATVIIIPAGSLPHSIAGSAEVMIGVLAGEVLWRDYMVGFLVPAVLGNTIGGVFFVSLLNYAQIIGSNKRTRLSGLTSNDENEESPKDSPPCKHRKETFEHDERKSA